MIKNVVFDIGMVLADFRWRKYLSDDLKFPPEVCREIGEKIVQTTMWDDLDLGVRDADEVIEEMKSKLPQYRKETDKFFNGYEDSSILILEKITNNNKNKIKKAKKNIFNMLKFSYY
jgi:putative hydrolase of the HAD superfamily